MKEYPKPIKEDTWGIVVGWKCSDGERFDRYFINYAIAHQKQLNEKEKSNAISKQ